MPCNARSILLAVAVAFGACGSAQAQWNVYHDKGEFLAAAGRLKTVTFDGGPAEPTDRTNPGAFDAEVRFHLGGKPGPEFDFFPGPPWVGSALQYRPVATMFSAITGTVSPTDVGDGRIYLPQAVGFDLSGNTKDVFLTLENTFNPQTDFSFERLGAGVSFVGIVYGPGFTVFNLTRRADDPDYEATFQLENLYVSVPVPDLPGMLGLMLGLVLMAGIPRLGRPPRSANLDTVSQTAEQAQNPGYGLV